MDDTHEDTDDVRSRKRQVLDAPTPAHAPSASTAAAPAVAALDDVLWTSIVEFLPIPRDLNPKDEKHYDAAVLPLVQTWHTLLHLRLVSKALATLLHPRNNVALWRRLVLQSFDFAVDGDGFNYENCMDDCELSNPEDDEQEDDEEEDDEEEDDEDEAADESIDALMKDPTPGPTDDEPPHERTEPNPQLVAMCGRYDNVPPEYLEESMIRWTKLGIYHRPSQYGFLTTLQQQPPVGEWPESEDPFTLFGDLVRLLHLPHGESMFIGGEASDTSFKFLAAPAEADATSVYHRFYVMKTLGYVPHFWHWGHGIGEPWKGFTDPDAFEAEIAAEPLDKYGDSASFKRRSEFAFPGCSVCDAERLFRHLRAHCRDWRSVCCNSGSDGYTPVFFVGESTRAPHRWTGYAGGKCWT